MLELVVPKLEDMWFREILLADEETMSYNHAWGGTIPFPKERWQEYFIKKAKPLCYYIGFALKFSTNLRKILINSLIA